MQNNKKQKSLFEYFSSPIKKIQTETNNVSFIVSENENNILDNEEEKNTKKGIKNLPLNKEKEEILKKNKKIELKSKIRTDEDSDTVSLDSFSSSIMIDSLKTSQDINQKTVSLDSFSSSIMIDPLKTSQNRNQKTPISLKESSQIDPERFSFLVDLRDKNMIRKGEPGYDPSTLYIPEVYFKKFTPFEKQYWNIKKEYFDTIVCFKKGKFYELYENDAEIGAKYFDLKITDRVNMKMVGFPEKSFDHWASKFLEKGFKIARVDQKENMIGKNMREREAETNKESKKSQEKIIHRELKEIITQGTVYNPEHLKSCFSIYTAALKIDYESMDLENQNKIISVSLILYDASINSVFYATFNETEDFSNLKTIFAKYEIKEVITDVNLKLDEPVIIIKPIKGNSDIKNKFKFSNEREYGCFMYLSNYMEYLKRGDFSENVNIVKLNEKSGGFLVLDSITLKNLEILRNNYDMTVDKSLFSAVNYCATPGGIRMLRKWILNPLRNYEEILKRQNITIFLNLIDFDQIYMKIKSFVDMERIIGKLFCGNSFIGDLVKFLNNLKFCCEIVEDLKTKIIKFSEKYRKENPSFYNYFIKSTKEEIDAKAEESIDLLNISDNFSIEDSFNRDERGCLEFYNLLKSFPSVKEILEVFYKNYCIKNEEISPGELKNDEICDLIEEMNLLENQLDENLQKEKLKLRCADLCYKNIGKEIFQIEVPNSVKIPENYILISSSKNFKRFYTLELKNMVINYMELEERIFQSRGSLLKRAVDSIAKYSNVFYQATSIISHIDCYFSFSKFSKIFKDFNFPFLGSKLDFLNMKNPIYTNYIPNDLCLQNERVMVLTGPNMGGKSTFLRSVCLNILLAHIGLKVACEKMEFVIFDRIFTRIGASDDLSKGKSTFMVELSETAKILNESTINSFVIIDELGRGTSTIDGEKIATMVLKYLRNKNIHTLFSTHYHKMIENISLIKKSYMKAVVDSKDIVFTYKLCDGICYDSHGISVAKMAGVPDIIIEKALEYKKELTEIPTPPAIILLEKVTKNKLDEAQLANLYNEIEKRKLHSKLYNARNNELVSVNDSSRWLKKGSVRPRDEAVFCYIQDRNVFWGAEGVCQHCNTSRKTVDHLATRCEKMLGHDYTRRHNEVVRCIHLLLL
ncbi:DNA mismatch repair protein MutS, partial [Hamiltosporidium magnivora]